MSEPVKAGDMAEVVGGLGRGKSPNIGLRVSVVSLQGEHGRVWRCTGDGIQQLTDAGTYAVTGWADFAQSWLRKIEPPSGTSQKGRGSSKANQPRGNASGEPDQPDIAWGRVSPPTPAMIRKLLRLPA